MADTAPAALKPTKRQQLERALARLKGEKQQHQQAIEGLDRRIIQLDAQIASLPQEDPK